MSNFIVSAEHAVKIMNEAFALNPSAIETLVDSRVSINEKLANHPTIQAGSDSEVYSLSIIGLLNGIFGIDENGQGPIARLYDISPDGSEVFAGFCINTNLKPDAKQNPANERHMSDRTGREEIPSFSFGTGMTPNPDKPIMRCG